ncbi:MAG: DUF4837 family protein [Bacteroidales bacterium]|nr:DUF4837 family protein [Bacteroidales bacterium]
MMCGKFFLSTASLLMALALYSCKEQTGGIFKPEVTGQSNEVLVVIGDAVKKDTAGAYLRYMLGDVFVGLPTAEPVFDMRTVPPGYFDRNMHNFRNLILVNVADTFSRDSIHFYKDMWAKPQAVVTYETSDPKRLPALMKRHHAQVIGFFHKAERERLMSYYKRINDPKLSRQVREKHNIGLLIPNQYEKCNPVNASALSWYMCDTKEFQDGLLIYSFPYEGQQSMSKEFLIAKRDELLRANILGPSDAPMMTELCDGLDAIDYKFGQKIQDGCDVAEIRGLWRLDGYPMGGPFVLRAVHDVANNRVVVTDGYVYYPSREHKRNHIRQLEAIMHSLTVSDTKK